MCTIKETVDKGSQADQVSLAVMRLGNDIRSRDTCGLFACIPGTQRSVCSSTLCKTFSTL